ncbi:hypothetical protein GCM10009113_25030 [Marinobacter szutsaonensis]
MFFNIVAVFLLFVSLNGYAHNGEVHQAGEQEANFNSALHWLETSQQPLGNVSTPSDISTSFQSTAEALRVFQLLESSGADKQAALEFLRGDLASLTTEQLSRLLVALAEANQTSNQEKTELLSRQGADSGFGHYAGYDSTPLDTSYALMALQAADSDALAAAGALQFLSSVQLPSGAFAVYNDQPSVMVTALAVKALKAYLYTHNISGVLSQAVDFLYASQNEEGHWGTDWESALALQALIPVTTDVSKYSGAVDYLKSSQSLEGHWGAQVYSTSLSVSALKMLSAIDVPVDPEKAVLAGRLVDSSSGASMSEAAIDVMGTSEDEVAIKPDGSFTVSNLSAGSYVVAYSAPGYLGASQSVTLREGQFANVGTIRLAVAPTTVLVTGVITDSSSGSPIGGVTVTSTAGGATNSTVTGTDGTYRLLSEPGTTVLSAVSSDHYPAAASVDLVAGTQVRFSPSLQPLTEEQPESSSVVGTIVDANSQSVEGALVVISGGSNTSLTDGAGRFSLSDLNGGEIAVNVSKSGFETIGFSLVVPEKTTVDIGHITLREEEVLPSTSVQGQVIDMVSGLGVAGATVSVGSLNATTDANGFYRITGIPVLEFTVSTNASGYLFSNKDVSLAEHSDLNLDINIRKADLGGVNIVRATTEKSAYGAYEPVLITADVKNETALNQGARFYVRVKDSAGNEIDSFSGVHLPVLDPQSDPEELIHYQEHLDAAVETFLPGEQRSIQLEQWWNTLRVAPGVYTLTVQALDGTTSNLVSESSTTVTVEPTMVLASLDPKGSPGYVLLNNQADVELFAEIHNRSNSNINLEFDYTFLDPEGQVITQGHSQLDLAPEDTNYRQVLTVLPYDFVTSGEYRIVLENVSGATVTRQSEGTVFVPPSIRLRSTQSLNPGEVVPLEGVSVESSIQVEGVDGE